MFIISYFLVIGCYLSITISVFLLRRRKKRASRQGRTVRISVSSKAERRFASTLAIVIGVFTACWFPMIVVFFVAGKSLVKMYGTAYMWIRTLALLNSAMNFLIYSARIRDFRDAYALICRKILRCGWCDLVMCILNIKGDKLLKGDIVLTETIYRYLTEASVPKTLLIMTISTYHKNEWWF